MSVSITECGIIIIIIIVLSETSLSDFCTHKHSLKCLSMRVRRCDFEQWENVAPGKSDKVSAGKLSSGKLRKYTGLFNTCE